MLQRRETYENHRIMAIYFQPGMEVDSGGLMGNKNSKHLSKKRDQSSIRGYSVHRDVSRSRVAAGMQRTDVQEKAEKLRRKKQRGLSKDRVKSRQGEGDRHVPDFKPKHLHCGKRGMGKRTGVNELNEVVNEEKDTAVSLPIVSSVVRYVRERIWSWFQTKHFLR